MCLSTSVFPYMCVRACVCVHVCTCVRVCVCVPAIHSPLCVFTALLDGAVWTSGEQMASAEEAGREASLESINGGSSLGEEGDNNSSAVLWGFSHGVWCLK